MSIFRVTDARLLRVMTDLGFDKPTEVQEAAIPEIQSGQHVLVIAPTGIGKTEAAMLPILERIVQERPPGIACLYITPLRALNRDMMRRLLEFGERLEISIGVRHGDTPTSERQKQSRNPPQILITTPETFQLLFLGHRLRAHLKNVSWVIVDEIHELAEDERGAQLSVGLERLAMITKEFQRIGLSATVGDPEKVAEFLAGPDREVKIVKTEISKDIDLGVESPTPQKEDDELAVQLHTDAKHVACMKRARELIDEHRSTLFFVNTRDTAEALGVRYRMRDENFRIGVHHGSLSKNVRIQMEEEFKKELLKALICTSSLELGIDIGSADFTIQFNSPRQVTRIIQRVGRSGHQVGRTSKGRILATDFNEIVESAVIARKAMKGELEHLSIRRKPLAVLANQIAAMCMTAGSMERDAAFSIVRKAFSFCDLKREDFDRVVSALAEIKVIRAEGERIRRTRKTMKYFFDNISMIPDERTYRIREIATRGIIGTLDESFVASSVEPYSTFVARGKTWQVVEIREDEVLVEEIREIAGTPSWAGEEIPIPFAVAQEVGRVRSARNMSTYPTDISASAEFDEFIRKQTEAGFGLPSSDEMIVERGNGLIVVHACFGTKVNETLSKLIGSLISAKIGESIGIDSNAYAIILRTPARISHEEIERVFRETDPDALEPLMRVILKSSSAVRWQFLHVAKKFGAVEKGADYRSVNLTRIMEFFEDSIIMDEAVDRTIFEELDLEGTANVLRSIREGAIRISSGSISPLGQLVTGERKELMFPRTADRTILMTLKKRLMNEQIFLHCLRCGSERKVRVENLPRKISCLVCDGVMLAAVRPYAKEDLRLLSKRRLTIHRERDSARLRRLHKSANLVMAHGRNAVMALVARGVGPDTAARLLYRDYRSEEEFLREILAAEIQYARTKRFWD